MSRQPTEHPSDDLPPIVVDSSVAIAYLLDEPGAGRIRATMATWARLDRELMVPSLFWLEVANTLGRTHGFQGEHVIESIDRLNAWSLVTVDADRTLLLLTIDHMERYRLTAYDAHFVALATTHRAEVATLDRAMARAVHRPIMFGDDAIRETTPMYEYEVTWPRYKEAARHLATLRADALAGRTG